MFYTTFTAFVQSPTVITTVGSLQSEKHRFAQPQTRFIRNLTHVPYANLVSFCQQSNLESYISIILFNNTETHGLEAAAVISVTLTGSTIPATAVTMA